MIFVRWSARSRTLHSPEVDGLFGTVTDKILLFAFETSAMEVESHTGHLSLKMVVHGEETYHLPDRRVALAPGRLLFVNAGERYASSIDHAHTRSVSFFLPVAEVRAAFASLTRTDRALLDDPFDDGAECPEVPQVAFRASGATAVLTNRLAAAAYSRGQPDDAVLEELVASTAAAALDEALRLVRPGAFHGRARRGTRAELIARVVRARDLVEDRHGHVSLSEMAAIACMSRYHFLRVFHEGTGLTPSAYARRIRLQRGLEAMRRSGSAQRGARAAGFASAGTFLRAVRRRD